MLILSMSKDLPMGFLVHICTYLKIKFASVTSDAFFNVLKSVKKNTIRCPSENIYRVKEVKFDDYDRGDKISTKFALAF
jgi:hypothetical protein